MNEALPENTEVMHLTTPSNAISNFTSPGILGSTPFVRHDFLEWDESVVDEALIALLTTKSVDYSGELSEAKSQS